MVLKTVDAHVAGAAVRWLTDGFPAPAGKTMKARAEWTARHADHVRRALTLEPRGHRDLVAAVLTEPVAPGAHAGALFMSADGYEPLSGHGAMALAALAVGREAIVLGTPSPWIAFDTPAGMVQVALERGDATDAVTARLRLAPSFPLHAGAALSIGARTVRADVAFAGAFHAIVDAESIGVPLDLAHLPELRSAARSVTRAVDDTLILKHPEHPHAGTVETVVFTSPAHDSTSALRLVGVSRGGRVDWCPSPAGMAAVMSVLDVMGLVDEETPLLCEGLSGGTCQARAGTRGRTGELASLTVDVSADCWTTGEHQFVLADADPFRYGVALA